MEERDLFVLIEYVKNNKGLEFLLENCHKAPNLYEFSIRNHENTHYCLFLKMDDFFEIRRKFQKEKDTLIWEDTQIKKFISITPGYVCSINGHNHCLTLLDKSDSPENCDCYRFVRQTEDTSDKPEK